MTMPVKKHWGKESRKTQNLQNGSNYRVAQDSNVRFSRSPKARKTFLTHKKGLFGTKLYVCVYCGKLISPRNMEVDHCLPVASAKRSKFVRGYIRFLGLFQKKSMKQEGINGAWNLVASCHNCNSKKSDEGGLWVLRGVVGRYTFPAIWYTGIGILGGGLAQFALTGQNVIWTNIFRGMGYLGEMFMKISTMFT